VHDRLMVMGSELVKKSVELLVDGKTDAIDQAQFIHPGIELKAAPKIFKETCEIDLSWNVERVFNLIRGLSPYPAAWVESQFPNQSDKMILKVFESEKEVCTHDLPVGTVVTDGKKNAKIALNDGYIILKSVQMAGKKRMEIGELLRGMR